MNAIPNQNYGYQRIVIPENARFRRDDEMGRLEYFDDYKARKSIYNSHIEEQKNAVSKNMAVNNISEFNRVSRQPNTNGRARQITPAYEVQNKQYVSRRDYYSNNQPTSNTSKNYANRGNNGYNNQSDNRVSRPSYNSRQYAYNTANAGQGSNYAHTTHTSSTQDVRRKQGVQGFDMHTNTAPKAQKVVKVRQKGIASTIFVILFTFVVLSGLLVRYANISNLSYNNAKIEANISAMEEELQKIQMDIALKDDLGSIQTRAQNELNMAHPGEERTVYVARDTENEYVSSAPKDEEGEVYITGENNGATTNTPTVAPTPTADAGNTTQNAVADPTNDENKVEDKKTDDDTANQTGQKTAENEIDFKALFN